MALYQKAHAFAKTKGIILADTKFEFGLIGDKLILIDEILTPDSSRFWDARTYQVGSSPPSFDKQIIRDYLDTCDWDKNPPPPRLPQHIIDQTSDSYLEILKRLTT